MLLTAPRPIREDFAAWGATAANTIKDGFDRSERGGGRTRTPAAASSGERSESEEAHIRQANQQVSEIPGHSHFKQQDRRRSIHHPHHHHQLHHLPQHHHDHADLLTSDLDAATSAPLPSHHMTSHAAPSPPPPPPPPLSGRGTGATAVSSGSSSYEDHRQQQQQQQQQQQTERLVSPRQETDTEDMTAKEANWFLDALESYHRDQLTPAERNDLENWALRDKAKHRHAVLFEDDLNFLIRGNQRLLFDATAFSQAFSRSSTCNGDRRVFMLREATKMVLQAYRTSRENAPPKSCIWSALMTRLYRFLVKSNVQNVEIVERVDGVKHKESTLMLQGYHISRSNFTKLARQIWTRMEAAESSGAEVDVDVDADLDAEVEADQDTDGNTPGHDSHASSHSAQAQNVPVPAALSTQARFGSSGASSMGSAMSSMSSSSSSAVSAAVGTALGTGTGARARATRPPPLSMGATARSTMAASSPSSSSSSTSSSPYGHVKKKRTLSRKRPASALSPSNAKSPRPASESPASIRKHRAQGARAKDRRGSAPPNYHTGMMGTSSSSSSSSPVFDRGMSHASFGQASQPGFPESAVPRTTSFELMKEEERGHFNSTMAHQHSHQLHDLVFRQQAPATHDEDSDGNSEIDRDEADDSKIPTYTSSSAPAGPTSSSSPKGLQSPSAHHTQVPGSAHFSHHHHSSRRNQ